MNQPPWKRNDPPKSEVKPDPATPPVSQVETKPVTPAPSPQATVLVSELDSYIHERIRQEPATMDEALARVEPVETPGLHYLSLPDSFEKISYDCTRGDSCTIHKKEFHQVEGLPGVRRMKILNRGSFVFRWVYKNKRSLDQAIDVRGWMFANRTKFPESPKSLFTANGGVERGDAILMFMPVERALRFRNSPSERSIERLKGRMTPSKDNPYEVLMSGNPDSKDIYMPDLSKESSDGPIEDTGITVSQ